MMFFVLSHLSFSAGFLSEMKCNMCSNKVEKSKANFTQFWKEYDFTENCKKLSRNNFDTCMKAAPEVMETLFNSAEPKSVCRMITLCDPAPKPPKLKAKSSASIANLYKEFNPCQYSKLLADYLSGKGLKSYTIPVIKKSFVELGDSFPSLKSYLGSATDQTITDFVYSLFETSTPAEFSAQLSICTKKEL
ncbi:hypothetical protein TVAG_144560 [Trichomonas vaginalis G3]|uniref:Saposin B-type domain-containing protein n=1 Tax=Trichomonas vaginalis (strain ATCC PRA-98 / G3) TaxID=412133 RepID=A2G1B7_TRIV3|nr:saposin family [Trichomonas vaginalis G3]EAX89050.1 hypothetical protein TVAG_144560 [Trichomonas vaginalis G3]KAI5547338.1 saposin family [Trichomonas vaginalis G3]|eukprot:XP_001301980.1 hypothetical protein [Trichomonas vaginalis G3]